MCTIFYNFTIIFVGFGWLSAFMMCWKHEVCHCALLLWLYVCMCAIFLCRPLWRGPLLIGGPWLRQHLLRSNISWESSNEKFILILGASTFTLWLRHDGREAVRYSSLKRDIKGADCQLKGLMGRLEMTRKRQKSHKTFSFTPTLYNESVILKFSLPPARA